MKQHRRILSLFSVLLLALVLALPAAASSSLPSGGALTPPAQNALAWLENNLPTAETGDEVALFALLRGGAITAESPLYQQYRGVLQAYIDDGTYASHSATDLGWQLLVLRAAGEDPGETAPQLVAQLATQSTQPDLDIQAARFALLVFGPAGVAAPDGVPDTAALALNLAGDGQNDALSSPMELAQVLQGLYAYRGDGDVELATVFLLERLRGMGNKDGSYSLNNTADPVATAEAAMALACYSLDTLGDGLPAPVDALAAFQNADGSFSLAGSTDGNLYYTAMGALALVAHSRQQAGLGTVFDLQDVPLLSPGEEEPAAVDTSVFSIPVIIAISTVALALILGIVIALNNAKNKRAAAWATVPITRPQTSKRNKGKSPSAARSAKDAAATEKISETDEPAAEEEDIPTPEDSAAGKAPADSEEKEESTPPKEASAPEIEQEEGDGDDTAPASAKATEEKDGPEDKPENEPEDEPGSDDDAPGTDADSSAPPDEETSADASPTGTSAEKKAGRKAKKRQKKDETKD